MKFLEILNNKLEILIIWAVKKYIYIYIYVIYIWRALYAPLLRQPLAVVYLCKELFQTIINIVVLYRTKFVFFFNFSTVSKCQISLKTLSISTVASCSDQMYRSKVTPLEQICEHFSQSCALVLRFVLLQKACSHAGYSGNIPFRMRSSWYILSLLLNTKQNFTLRVPSRGVKY
jgi:hypothetical protein